MGKRARELAMLICIEGVTRAGKTSLRDWLLLMFPKVERGLRITTRGPRVNERRGKDYRHVKGKTFDNLQKRGRLLGYDEPYRRRERYAVDRQDTDGALYDRKSSKIGEYGPSSLALRQEYGVRHTLLIFVEADQKLVAGRLIVDGRGIEGDELHVNEETLSERLVVEGIGVEKDDFYRRVDSVERKMKEASKYDIRVRSESGKTIEMMGEEVVQAIREVERKRGIRIRGFH